MTLSEPLDARVYAYAALRSLVSMALDAEADRIAVLGATLREPGPNVPRVSRSKWMSS